MAGTVATRPRLQQPVSLRIVTFTLEEAPDTHLSALSLNNVTTSIVPARRSSLTNRVNSHNCPKGALIRANGIIYNTIMKPPRIVLDTNVPISALRSKRGASYRLLMRLDSGVYEPVVSVPLVLEYEAAAKKLVGQSRLTARDVEAIIDYICAEAVRAKIFYLWRPILKDTKDDMVLEVAVASGCSHIVTFNTRDFAGAERFGVQILTPQAFLAEIGEKR